MNFIAWRTPTTNQEIKIENIKKAKSDSCTGSFLWSLLEIGWLSFASIFDTLKPGFLEFLRKWQQESDVKWVNFVWSNYHESMRLFWTKLHSNGISLS